MSLLSQATEARDLTLAWVNERREQAGLPTLAEMPCGGRSGDTCPVYHALKDTDVLWVGRSFLSLSKIGDDDESLPEFVETFIEYHDTYDAYGLRDEAQ